MSGKAVFQFTEDEFTRNYDSVSAATDDGDDDAEVTSRAREVARPSAVATRRKPMTRQESQQYIGDVDTSAIFDDIKW